MRKSRFTEERIALALRQVDAGAPLAHPCGGPRILRPTSASRADALSVFQPDLDNGPPAVYG